MFCGSLESRDHLLFTCPYSEEVWRNMTLNCPFLSSNWHGFLHWGSNHLIRSRSWMTHIKLIWGSCIYNLWRERNLRVHTRVSRDCATLIAKLKADLEHKLCS